MLLLKKIPLSYDVVSKFAEVYETWFCRKIIAEVILVPNALPTEHTQISLHVKVLVVNFSHKKIP